MLKNIFLLIWLLMPLISVAQTKPRVFKWPTKREYALAEKRNQCFETNKYSAEQRLDFFPFSKASIIKIISYEGLMPNYEIKIDGGPQEEINPWDTTEIFIPMAVNHFKLNDHRIKEQLTLTKAGVDSLTHIFYNIDYTPVKNLKYKIFDPGSRCYNPRNAILFFDENGRLAQYIEFCFECQKYYLSSSQINNPEYCEQKFDMLKAFFLAKGIKYGTILPKRSE